MITAYPLTWPKGFPRSPERQRSQFKATLSAALKNVQESLRMFANDSEKEILGLIISSNVTLGAQQPGDPGVAVWFTWDRMQVCIAVDRYLKIEDNLQAIHHIVEARRVEMRHGTLALVRASFTGFKALPTPPGTDWRSVLKFSPGAKVSRSQVEGNFRELSKKAHPDAGGSEEAMVALTQAKDDALRELGGE